MRNLEGVGAAGVLMRKKKPLGLNIFHGSSFWTDYMGGMV